MDIMKILQTAITSMGIVTNLIVVTVFVNDRKLRRKIPNICIINQVRKRSLKSRGNSDLSLSSA